MSTNEAQQPPSQGNGASRVVKRYSNRKLYDTVESRYVTLPQIADLVRRGEDVQIIDNNTKEDLTRVTMAQILYEEERKQQSRALPLAALKDLLHASGERLMSAVREGPVGKLIRRDDEPEAAPPAPPPAPPVSDAKGVEHGRVQQFVEQSREAIDQWQHQVDQRIRNFFEGINPAVQLQTLQSDVRRLNARVDALESELRAVKGETSPEE